MNKIIANFSGKLDVEIFRENKDGYYDYKISDHSNRISCFVYGQPLEKVDQIVKALENINFAQMEKIEKQQEESEIIEESIIEEEIELTNKEINESVNQNKPKNIFGRAGKISPEDSEEINEMYNDGETINSLADLFGVSKTTIRYHLRNNENYLKTLRTWNPNQRVKKEDEQSMFSYKNKGLSCSEIGRLLGFNKDTVRNHLKCPKFLSDFDIFVLTEAIS